MQITNGIKTGLNYIAIFFGIVVVLLGLLLCSAKIPQEKIQSNMEASADYLCQGELFGEQIEGIDGTRIDRYADSILLGIAYWYDEDKPMQSVMWSSYYYTDVQNENQNLWDAVYHGYEANQQYMRYWHGSIVLVRPMLCFWNIQEIYRINGMILFVLMAILCIRMAKKKAYIPMIGLVTGCILTSAWCVPFSLEYTWTFMLMLIFSLIGWELAQKEKWKKMGYCFMIAGMVTAYMDFLTTETLTLLVPLLLVLWNIQKEFAKAPEPKQFSVWMMVTWGIGYAGMWIAKWGIASLVLQENGLAYVVEHVEERIDGDVGENGIFTMGKALMRNIGCLFPFEYGVFGILAGIGLILLAVYIGYVYRKKEVSKEWICLYAGIGMIPYVRYIALHNHSYIHYFFTYRAQLTTIFAMVLLLDELAKWRWKRRASGKRRRT